MLAGYILWDNTDNIAAGYATVEYTIDGKLIDIEVVNCTLLDDYIKYWVNTAWKLCNEYNINGIVVYQNTKTITIRQCTPF